MNRWFVVALLLMAAVVAGRHVQRLTSTPGGDETALPAMQDPLGVQVAHADPLPPVESGGQPEASGDGGALGVPDRVAENDVPAEPEPVESTSEERSSADLEETRRLRVPLNPEPPLPEKDRPRAAPRTQGPLTNLDPHQMLFEPGDEPARPAVRKRVRRDPTETQGPLTKIDPRQMLFEPGERPPRDAQREPAATEEPGPPVSAPADAASEPAPDATSEPRTDAQAKARIMKRLLRVMELAGEKP